MSRTVALLRGVNVGGRTKVGMDDLRQLFADLGHQDVTTYIQSGNVLFTPPAGGRGTLSRLARDIEDAISRELSLTVTVLLRTADELAEVVKANPFVRGDIDPAKLHVTFLAGAPDKKRSAALNVPSGEPDELAVIGREVYLHCPNGYGRSKMSNTFLEKELGVRATTRGWKTVTKLCELAAG